MDQARGDVPAIRRAGSLALITGLMAVAWAWPGRVHVVLVISGRGLISGNTDGQREPGPVRPGDA